MVSFSLVDTVTAAPIGAFVDEEIALTVAEALGQSQGMEHIAVQCEDGRGHAMVIAEGSEVTDRAAFAARWEKLVDPDGTLARWEKLVDPDGTLEPTERIRRAEAAKKLHLAHLNLASQKSRLATANRKRGQLPKETVPAGIPLEPRGKAGREELADALRRLQQALGTAATA